MVRRLLRLAGVVALLAAVAGALFVLAFRTGYTPILDAIRRVNRRYTNPRILATAGQPGASASVVHHVGRRSGTEYRTPVVVAAAGDDLVVALPYGPGTDWVRNVLAAGSATIDHDGEQVEVVRPEVVSIAEVNHHFPEKEQRTHLRFGVTDALVLQRPD